MSHSKSSWIGAAIGGIVGLVLAIILKEEVWKDAITPLNFVMIGISAGAVTGIIVGEIAGKITDTIFGATIGGAILGAIIAGASASVIAGEIPTIAIVGVATLGAIFGALAARAIFGATVGDVASYIIGEIAASAIVGTTIGAIVGSIFGGIAQTLLGGAVAGAIFGGSIAVVMFLVFIWEIVGTTLFELSSGAIFSATTVGSIASGALAGSIASMITGPEINIFAGTPIATIPIFIIPMFAIIGYILGIFEISRGRTKHNSLIEGDEIARGLTLAKLGRFEEAIKRFDKAIELNTKNENAWYSKGFALMNLGRLEEAISCFNIALEISPRYVDAWNNKGSALAILGRFDEAMTCFDRVIEINPRDRGAKMNRIRVLNMQRNYYREEKSATKTYSNEKYGFSIKYPKDWILDSLDPKTEYTVKFGVWLGFQGKVACSIMVGPIGDTTYGRIIQELENRARISRQGLNARLVSSKHLTIDGIDAYEHVYTAEHPNRYVKQVGFFKGDDEYLLLFKVFSKEDFEKYEPIFNEIIQSFRFKKRDQELRLSEKMMGRLNHNGTPPMDNGDAPHFNARWHG